MTMDERQRIEEQLRPVADPIGLLVSLFAHAPVGFAVWRADGRPLLSNRAFRGLFRAESPPGCNVLNDELFAANGTLAAFQCALAGEAVQVPTFWCDAREEAGPAPEARRVAIAMTVFPLASDGGEIGHVAATCCDQTEIMVANELLKEGEDDLRTTVDSLGDAVIATDAAGYVTGMNRVAEQLTGWSRGQALGTKLTDVFCIRNETTREAVESPVDRILRQGGIAGLRDHSALIARDGSERPIANSGAPIRDRKGELRGVVVVFRDQTEERRAERDAKQSAARLQVLADTSHQFSATTNVRDLLEIIARRLSEVVGDLCAIRLVAKDREWLEPIGAVWHPDPATLAAAREFEVSARQRLGEGISGRVAATGRSILVPVIDTAQLMAQSPPKFRAWIKRLGITSVLAVPLTSKGRVIGVINLSRSDAGNPYTADDERLAQDLADRAALAMENALLLNELEDRVAERTASLEQARSELEAFSYSVAHDLRAPLRGINGFSTALLEDCGDRLDGAGKAHLNRILAGAERMGQLIDALLALARVTRAELRREPVNLAIWRWRRWPNFGQTNRIGP